MAVPCLGWVLDREGVAAAPPLVARGRGSARDTALGGCLGNNKEDLKRRFSNVNHKQSITKKSERK